MTTETVEIAPYLSWSTYKVWKAQVEYLMTEEGMSEKEAEASASEDSDIYDFEWEYVTESLTELMNRIGKGTTEWVATVTGFGWRSLDGTLAMSVKDGAEMLRKVLPDTENTFTLYDMGDHIKINNAHHDKPTGGEIYEIRPVKVEEDT